MSFIKGQGFVHDAAGGGVSGDGTGITDAEAFRGAIAAQSTDIQFLERFGRRASGSAVTTGTTPEIGSPINIIWNNGSANPTIVNGALECAAGTQFYLGSNVTSPGNKFKITVIAELRINAGFTSGSTVQDLTFGVNAKEFSTTAGLSTFLNSPRCLHAQVRTDGSVGGDFYVEAPSITRDHSSDTLRPMGAGFKFPITLDVDGPNDILRVTVAGRTNVFRDSRYSRCVGEALTGFFVQWSAPGTDVQYYWAVHSIAVNAPEFSDSNDSEGGQYGRALHDLMTRDTATLPSRQRILGGQVRFNDNQGVLLATDSYAIAGNPHLGYAPYFRPAPFVAARASGVSNRVSVALQSAAGASDANIHEIQNLEVLTTYAGNQLGVGSWMRSVYIGQFAANTNTKRIKVIANGGSPPTRFDSGDIVGADGNNGQFVFINYQIRRSDGFRYVNILEWSVPGSRTPFRVQSFSSASSQLPGDQIRVTGTLLGDITINHWFTEMNPHP